MSTINFTVVTPGGTFTFYTPNVVQVAGSVRTIGKVSATLAPSLVQSVAVLGRVGVVGNVSGVATRQYHIDSAIGSVGSVSSTVRAVNGTVHYLGQVGVVGSVSAISAVHSSELRYTGAVGAVVGISSQVMAAGPTSATATGQVSGVVGVSSKVVPTNYAYDTCKITMTLRKIDRTPVGRPVQIPYYSNPNGAVVWRGVNVTAKVLVAHELSGETITLEEVTAVTDETGFAKFKVVQGETVAITSPCFGRTIMVSTAGKTTIDLNSIL